MSIQMASGRYFPFDGPYEFRVREIAASLAKLCRFNGHCRDFYSVAQHSVHVSEIVPPEFAFEGLMHDAIESILGDMTSPLKRRMVDYRLLEQHIEGACHEWFGLPLVESAEVKRADLVMLATERRDLMPMPDANADIWACINDVQPRAEIVTPWSWTTAEAMFIRRFAELTSV